jgi:hypothetical protein
MLGNLQVPSRSLRSPLAYTSLAVAFIEFSGALTD